MSLTNFIKLQVSGGSDLKEFWRSAVDEFRAELNWHGRTLLAMRQDAAADALARFKHHDVTAGMRQFACGSQTSGARANDNDWILTGHSGDRNASLCNHKSDVESLQ
jgi:hypothetical protein